MALRVAQSGAPRGTPAQLAKEEKGRRGCYLKFWGKNDKIICDVGVETPYFYISLWDSRQGFEKTLEDFCQFCMLL